MYVYIYIYTYTYGLLPGCLPVCLTFDRLGLCLDPDLAANQLTRVTNEPYTQQDTSRGAKLE